MPDQREARQLERLVEAALAQLAVCAAAPARPRRPARSRARASRSASGGTSRRASRRASSRRLPCFMRTIGARDRLAVLEAGVRGRERQRHAQAARAALAGEHQLARIVVPRQRAPRADAAERVERQAARRAEQRRLGDGLVARGAARGPDQVQRLRHQRHEIHAAVIGAAAHRLRARRAEPQPRAYSGAYRPRRR